VAYAVPFTVLPASLWRILPVVFHFGGAGSPGSGTLPAWLPVEVYAVFRSILSEVLAFTAVGMIAQWGRWFRVGSHAWADGGRLDRERWNHPAGHTATAGLPGLDARLAFRSLIACYAPLLLWGPLLGTLTVAYWRRRRHATPEAA